MTTDCSQVTSNDTYDCSRSWGQNCKISAGFNFADLWNYTQKIQQSCDNDTRLFQPAKPENAALTQSACANVAGSSWAYYPGDQIWTRVTTWKFPLLQLVSAFPRPPLSFWVEMFVINHLLGDPLDTLQNLFSKLSTCEKAAKYWKTSFQGQHGYVNPELDQDWKTMTIIEDTYGEWGIAEEARQLLYQSCHNSIPQKVQRTANALAADRSTKALPIVVAQCFFISSVGIAIFRTAAAANSSTSSDSIFINVEAHSIAFSSLYFWIIPAVFLASIIGVSQTKAAMPDILGSLEDDINLKSNFKKLNGKLDQRNRIYQGGIYSWQPPRWHTGKPLSWKEQHRPLPYIIVLLGIVSGITISALVPPDGFDCRHIAQISIFVIWVVSREVGICLQRFFPLTGDRARLFWCTYIKDLIATTTTMGGIIATQVGLFNRCACYTRWGGTGLALPEMPDVAAVLSYRLGTAYPAITFSAIGLELIIVPVAIWWWYPNAMRVFVQRDDGESNARWYWQYNLKVERVFVAIETFFRGK